MTENAYDRAKREFEEMESERLLKTYEDSHKAVIREKINHVEADLHWLEVNRNYPDTNHRVKELLKSKKKLWEELYEHNKKVRERRRKTKRIPPVKKKRVNVNKGKKLPLERCRYSKILTAIRDNPEKSFKVEFKTGQIAQTILVSCKKYLTRFKFNKRKNVILVTKNSIKDR